MATTDSADAAVSETDAELLQEIRLRYQASKNHWKEWIDNAKEYYRFYSGDQWSVEDKQYLRDQQRPEVTFNRVQVLIDAVLGHEQNNRNEVRYLPRTHGDAAVDEILTNVSKYFLDECDGETHQSDAFRDMLIAGIGWTNTRLDDEQNPDFDLRVERVDPLEMLVDPSSSEPNFADARYMFRRKRMAIEEVRAQWPDWKGEGDVDTEWNDDQFDTDDMPSVQHSARDSYSGSTGMKDDKSVVKNIPVLEYQWKDIEPYHLVEMPQAPGGQDGTFQPPPQLERMDPAAFKARRSKIEKAGLNSTTKKSVTYRRVYVIGAEVVQEDVISPKSFTYHAMTGKRDREKGTWFGLMHNLMDPQRWANKWLSQMMHIINTNATSGLNVEESAVDDITELEAKHAQPGRVLKFRDGALTRNAVQMITPMSFPTNVEKLLEYANQSFMDVSGINAELLGMADREQAGVLEYQRKQSAVSLLAPIFDSLRRYRKMFGRTWLYFIQKYVSDGRIARISQDDKQQYLNVTPEIVGDPDTARYDVIVDQGANTPNQKEATWSVLTSLFPAIKDSLDPQTMLLFLEYSPLPETLVNELKQQADQKAQQGPPPDPAMMKAQAEVQATQMKSQADQAAKQKEMEFKQQQLAMELDVAKQKAQNDLEIQRMKGEAQTQVLQQKSQMDMQRMQQEQQVKLQVGQDQLGFDRQRHAADMQMTGQKHANDMSMAKEKQANDFALKGIDTMSQGGDLKSISALTGADGMSSAIAQLSEGLKSLQDSQAQQSQMLAEALKNLGRPRKVMRGPDGRMSELH